ncbi:MAG: family 78 glycoside hydrolase catalytic domain, partial [Lentimicrobiaceae bacterium]|nr:family 78 glycoside hydrolase catalytic domain [Lentimicrobiaceae bacterium]
MKYNRRKFIKTGSILIGSYSVVKASEPWFDKKSKVWDEIRETTLSNLRCEYLTDPLGIDTDHPRFSWEIIDFRRAVRQTAYQVLVASSLKALKRDEADLWDTGRVESDVTIQIEYNGKPLASSTVCFWKVRVWTTALKSMENGSDWSKPALFSVGLLQEMDWKAKWITAPDFISDSPMHVGYMSLKVNDPNDQKWVQIDLVTQKNINGIRLHRAAGRRGVYPNGGELSPSYDFPLRFKIEVSDYEDMSVKSMVSDYTKEDVVSPEKEPFNIRFTEVKGRYVRLTSLKQRVVLKLAGMEVLHGETDLAKGCKATALDSYEDIAAGFGISLLTAGKTQYDGGSRRRLRPAPLLRGEFVCKKPVKRAITYSTALGNYELRINGTRISDTYMAPGYTQYNKRVPIQTFDVTSVLHEGANAAGAILADGWYRSRYRLDGYDQFKDFAQGRFGDIIPRFLLQIEIEYEDGTREITGTNETWSYTFEGPYRKTSMYDGIIYDSRCELPGWNEPGYHGEGWKSTVVSKPAWKLHLWPQTVQPIICRGKFKPLSLKQTPSGNWICDFGQGVGGVCRVTLDGAAGTKVKLRHAMALNEDGSLYTKNLWGAYDNGDVYILAGKGPQTFTPDFTFHGFRYVEISGLVSSVNLIDITALMISDSCPVTANFETSDLRLNKLWSAVSMTFLSCLKSSMADVADRDERWGWMGDC